MEAANGFGDLRADRAFVLQVLESCTISLLPYVADALCGDREIVLKCIERDGSHLSYASEELMGDRTIILIAVDRCGRARMFAYATDALKAD